MKLIDSELGVIPVSPTTPEKKAKRGKKIKAKVKELAKIQEKKKD